MCITASYFLQVSECKAKAGIFGIPYFPSLIFKFFKTQNPLKKKKKTKYKLNKEIYLSLLRIEIQLILPAENKYSQYSVNTAKKYIYLT